MESCILPFLKTLIHSVNAVTNDLFFVLTLKPCFNLDSISPASAIALPLVLKPDYLILLNVP